MRAQRGLAEAFESHYTEATTLLISWREWLQEIKQTNNLALKHQVIELLVGVLARDTTSTCPVRTAYPAQRAALSTQAFGHQIAKILRQARCDF